MSLSRRGFLGTLLASVGALTLDPSKLLWMPAPAELGLPALENSALLTLDQMTREICRGLSLEIQGKLVDKDRIGPLLQHQYHVSMENVGDLDHHGFDRERYLAPIVAALMLPLKATNANRFGLLSLPSGVDRASTATNPDTGVSVRGISHVHLDMDSGIIRNIVRFDVLCGKAA